MKRFLYASSILFVLFAALFTAPAPARASEGDGGHELTAEVNGYHVTLSSQNEWAKGENVLVVTIADSMGMPLRDAEVEILVAPKDGHAESGEDAMPEMDMGNDQPQGPEPGVMKPVANNDSEHDEKSASPIAMTESEHGVYTVQTHFESSGEHDVHVMFHVNGEMLQADFVVSVKGSNSKSFVLGSFAAINVAIVAAAGALKKQKKLTAKGGK